MNATETETREQVITRWEKEGRLDPACAGCRIYYESPLLPYLVFAPRHQPKDRCKSGKRNHCTCDNCW